MLRFDWLKLLLCGCALIPMTAIATAAPILNTDNPVCFFTNVASRLLSRELNINLTRIEIYPTNQYTPAVHRLLQVTANIYDATSTNFYPSRFRPVFQNDGTNVFITGYSQQTNLIVQDPVIGELGNPDLAIPCDASFLLNLPMNTDILTNVYGVPWIIGVKKGFPNFNEFSLENAVQISRTLQYSRDTNTWQYSSNQMYIMSISNYFGVECWNSYSNNYSGPIGIMVRDNMALTLTNDAVGFSPLNANIIYANNPLPFSTVIWPGYQFSHANSFLIPLNASILFLTNSIYNYGNATYPQTGFIPLSQNPARFVDNGTPPLPHFVLLTTNRLQVAIVDYSAGLNAGQIIDYVQLNGMAGSLDINATIADPDLTGLWSTNLINNNEPYGVNYQTIYSEDGTPALPAEDSSDSGIWSSAQVPGLPPGSTTPIAEQLYFLKFFALSLAPAVLFNGHVYTLTYTSNNLQAPYTPMRTRVQKLTWQVNDPLVHYLTSDLADPFNDTNLQNFVDWPWNLGQLNERYMPWGGNPSEPNLDLTPYNIALKDSLVYSSDNWNFPQGQPLNSSWIGQVHRGTPWQTIYLKTTNILAFASIPPSANGLTTWQNWTGDLNVNDAVSMAPIGDWRVASLLASLFNTNNITSLFPVNNPSANAWQGLLNGLTATTNIPNQFDSVLISSNSSQAIVIANAVESERAVQPGQFFSDVGDILATAQLAEQSPFLTGLNLTNAISDAFYEIIPSQLLSLLRADSIGSVGLMNGQSLFQFTGYDGHAYIIQASSNLVNWVSVSTNYPVNGMLNFTNSATQNANQQFYRSVLLQ